jgi:hypothetical protein
MTKTFLLSSCLSLMSSICNAADASALVDALDKDLETLRVTERNVSEVRLRRDRSSSQENVGRYFAGKAYVRIALPEEESDEDIEIPFNETHLERLNQMDLFLQSADAKWRRNHLCADLFALVYDTRDESYKVLDGTLLAQKNIDVNNKVFFDFDLRPNNQNLGGYKLADFVSSSFSRPSETYEFIDKDALRPVSDAGNHGDRLALDTIKTNPHLFFNLIRRTAHREDLKILSMGTRFISSYDACQPCFEKICDSRDGAKTTLNTMASTQGYSLHPSVSTDGFPMYGLFYSARPYWKTPERTYVAYWEEEHNVQTTIKYTFPGPVYHLDLKEATDEGRQALSSPTGDITVMDNPVMKPERIYHYCRELTLQDGTNGRRIQYRAQ